jgi:predicted HAD superfamily Cof-like phosphohydrolase
MRSLMRDVAKFHEKFGRPIGSTPLLLSKEDTTLRIGLISEEALELIDAMRSGNLTEIADGIADLIYVTVGASLEYGIDADAVWDEVQRSNLTKSGGGVRYDGKILKGPNFEPPEIDRILSTQAPLAEKLKENK